MGPHFWMWLIGQTLVIALAIIGTFMRIQVSIARLEGKVEVLTAQQVAANQALDKNDKQHQALADQVSGISRGLARVEGIELGRQGPPSIQAGGQT